MYELLKERKMVAEDGKATDNLYGALGLQDGLDMLFLFDTDDSEKCAENNLLASLVNLYIQEERLDLSMDFIQKLLRNYEQRTLDLSSATEEEKNCYVLGFGITFCLLPSHQQNLAELREEAFDEGYDAGYDEGYAEAENDIDVEDEE